MSPVTATLDDILKKLPTLTKTERRKLLAGLCADPDLWEDIRDVATLLERKGEPSRPYEEFVEDLKAEGRL